MHMSQQESRAADSQLSNWGETSAPSGHSGIVPLSAASNPVTEEAGCTITRMLNGPLTALAIYMEELKQHSRRVCVTAEERDHLQKLVENALQQTRRVCALVKQVAAAQTDAIVPAGQRRVGHAEEAREANPAALAMLSSDAGRKRLTRREREVLNLISEGFSNKQGALRMQISPRTFESHRAEAMRKLGARNTADLVRAALLHPID
jgi:DNA-binding CsgD family transcriptional regulator